MDGSGKHGSVLRALGSKAARVMLSAALASSCCFPSLALAQAEPSCDFAAAVGVGGVAALSVGTQDADTFADDLANSVRGTEANPYRVSTVTDLQALAAVVNDGNALAGKFVILQNDIAFADDTAWTPIGNETTSFGGTFDGAGHTISNFHVMTTAVKYVGLFGAVSPAEKSSPAVSIKNLRLIGKHATGASTDVDVQGDLANYETITGGLVGWVGSRAVSVSNCAVDVNVKGTWRVGGIVGGSSSGCTALSISNCLSSGNVYGYDGGGNTSAHIGGIVGDWPAFTSASMANCLYLGQVTPSAGALATDSNTWRLTSNALIGRVGSTSNATVPTALQQNNWYVGQAVESVKATRAGSATTVKQVEGNVTPAPTEETVASIAKDVNGGQSPQVWQVLDGLVPVPAPFGDPVEYPPEVHSIAFEANGGTWAEGIEAALPTLFAEGGEARELPDAESISRAGHVFKGWYLSPDFAGNPVTTVPTESTTDLVFYAKWARVVTVTFDAGAGSFDGETTQQLEAGEKVSRPSDPTPPAGKDFVGWFVKGSDATSLAWDFSVDAVNGDLTLVARYRGETVQVVFDPNGGTLGAGTASPVEVEKGTPVAKPSKDPTRAGYTFAGWQLGGGAYDFGFAVNLPTTLVAAWTKNPPAQPTLETGDAAYNLDDVQYAIGEEPSKLCVVASLPSASAGSLSYQWYRSASAAQNPAADTRLGRGRECLPDVSAAGTWYYYCVVSNTLDGEVSTVASSSAKVQVVASPTAIENTFPAEPSAAGEIILSTRADFEAFRDAVNAGTLYGKTVKLAHDIDLAGSQSNQWTPIGKITAFKSGKPDQATGFTGTFDGRGHTVSGLYINASTGGQALFAYLPAGSTVRNFVVKGSVTADGSCVAGVVGATPRSRDAVAVRDVGSEVDVTSTATTDYVYAGGIVGFAEYATTEISGCYNAGAITTNRSYSYVGGIVGADGAVSDCYNLGAVTANNSNSNTYCGGIAGQTMSGNCSLTRCYNNASVTLNGTGVYCGAVVGSGASAASACYYNASAATAYGSSAGCGGYVSAAGIAPYSSASELLSALAAAAPGVWKDGAAINVKNGGTPALAWQAADVKTYTIGTAPAANGSFSVSHSVAAAGMDVTVDAFPNAGYVLDAISVTDGSGNAVSVTDGAFVMPAANVTVAVSFKEAPHVFYKVGKAEAVNGSFVTDADEALVNAKVTVSATPDSGYEVESIGVKDARGRDVAVTGATFVMPASDVTVTVTFKQCSYMDARVTVNPVAGEIVGEDYSIQLVDEEYGTVYRPSSSFASGAARVYLFSAAEGHTYRVEPDPGEYELTMPAEIYLNSLQGGVITKSVQLKYKDVEYTVTFDPGEGSFAEGSDADLAGGKVVRTVANGQTVAAPTAAPQREGYAFAGWYEGETRFLSYVPVTADATYTARWVDPSQATDDTFLADVGGARDGSYAAPYRVTTEQDLRELAAVVNGATAEDGAWADASSANALAGKFVSLESDIALTEAFTPIGIGSAAPSGAYRARPFSGTFMGGGHVVSGLTVTGASNPEFSGPGSVNSTLVTHHGAGAYSALFGAVAGATIQDLTVQLGEGGLGATAPCAGLVALVGAGMTRIGHCGVEGAVSGSRGATGANMAGGLVALFDPAGASGALKVDHCYQAGSVSSENIAGGLVGAVGASGAVIQSSYHVGSVSSAGTCGSFIGGATADGPSSTVSACATDLAESVAAVGGNAAAYAKLDGILAGLTVSDWAASDEGDGVRTALGSTYFDFDAAHDDGSPKLRTGVVWSSGYGVSFAPGAEGITGVVPSLPDQDAGAKVVLPGAALARDGYAFAGWLRSDGEDATVYQAGALFTMPAHAVEFAAVWEKVAAPEPEPEPDPEPESDPDPEPDPDPDPEPDPVVYTVTFVDEDGSTVLKAAVGYAEGTAAADIARPENPVKPSTAEYDYTFVGWTPEISNVSGNATYKATYAAAKRSYTVTFKNGAEVLQSSTVRYGAIPSYNGVQPTKAATARYSFTFKGWSAALKPVTGDAVYTAVFDDAVRSYKVTWKSGSAVLASGVFAYGTKPVYSGKTPTKASDAGYTYAFSGWSPSVAVVTGAATYTAQFKATARVSIAKAKVELKRASRAYTGSSQKGKVSRVTLGGKTLRPGVDYQVTVAKSGKSVGSYRVTVTGIGSYKGVASTAFKVTPAANKVIAKGAKKTLRAKKSGKKKALAKTRTLKLPSLLKASAKTPLKFAKANKAGAKKVVVSASGKLMAKKGLRAGTYKVKVRLTASAKGNYGAAAAKVVILKLVVK